MMSRTAHNNYRWYVLFYLPASFTDYVWGITRALEIAIA